MEAIVSVRGFTPEFPELFVDNARIIGDVRMGNECSVWYNAVIRGDVNSVLIGNRVNIQDGAIIHCTYKKAATYIGDNVSIGHGAIVHGSTIKDNVLIGRTGAIIMDNAIIEENVLIAAGAIVLENAHLESGFIYENAAKKLKKLDEENVTFM